MANYLSDNALCLRVTDFSETSQIVGLFTRRHGLVPMIAKGSKRVTKKGRTGAVSGPLDLLTAGEVVFIPAKGAAELATLAAWELTDHRTGLRRRLSALNGGMLCAEVTLGLLHPHDPHEELFLELQAALDLLGQSDSAATAGRAVVAYVKAALTAAGYRPHLESCVECGTALATMGAGEEVRFSPLAGGIICASCSARGSTIVVAARLALALARLPTPRQLLAAPPDRPADASALCVALEMLLAQIEALLDRALKTRSLVPTIFRG